MKDEYGRDFLTVGELKERISEIPDHHAVVIQDTRYFDERYFDFAGEVVPGKFWKEEFDSKSREANSIWIT